MSAPVPSPAVARVLERLQAVRGVGSGWTALCPAHSDTNPSLSIAEGEDGRALVTCRSRGCSAEAVAAAIGLNLTDLFADTSPGPARRGRATAPPARDLAPVVAEAHRVFAERRADPAVLAALARYHGTPEALDACGGGVMEDDGTLRLVFPQYDPTGRPCGAKLRPGPNSGKEEDAVGGRHGLMGQVGQFRERGSAPVLVCEGAHDLIAVLACGRFSEYIVVALPGAGFFAEERGKEWARALAGREVVLCLDADEAGKRGTAFAVTALRTAGASVRTLDWSRILDGGTVAKDLAEIISSQHPAHLERLAEAVREAPAKGLRFRTVEELRKMPGRKVEWLLAGWIGIGQLTVLAAAFKVGKSTLIAAILRAIETGAKFAEFATVKSTAVYLSEESVSGVLEKCDLFGVRDAVFLTREDFDPSLSFADYIREAVAEAKRRGALLLVIDTFARFGRLGADAEKDAGSVQAVVEHALAAAGGGIAVLLVTHHRKAEGEHGERIRGSTALPAAVDVLVEVRRADAHPRGPYRILSFESRYRETPTEEVVLELRGSTYLRAGTRATLQQDAAKGRVLRVLGAAQQPMTREAVEETAGGKRAANGKVLKALVDSGEVSRTGDGKKGSPHLYALRDRFPSPPSHSPPEAPGRAGEGDSRPPVPPVGGGGGNEGIDPVENSTDPVLGTGTGIADPPCLEVRLDAEGYADDLTAEERAELGSLYPRRDA